MNSIFVIYNIHYGRFTTSVTVTVVPTTNDVCARVLASFFVPYFFELLERFHSAPLFRFLYAAAAPCTIIYMKCCY